MTETINREADYYFLISEFTKEKIKQRYSLLFDNAKNFIRDRGINEYVQINTKSIKDATIDYFADIYRLKKFHKIKKINAVKIAAYTSYWIYKRKPLVILKNIPKEVLVQKPYLTDINEWFSAFLPIAMVFNTSESNLLDALQIKKWTDFMITFNYYFVYRTVTAQAIELILLGLKVNSPYNL